MDKGTKERMKALRGKFYAGTITKEEKKILFQHYRHLCSRGVVNEMIIKNFLLLTRPRSGVKFFKE